jgi:type III pantothenate kinase
MSLMLVVDVGNTTIHAGLFEQECLRDQWRLPTRSDSTPDEIGLALSGAVGHAVRHDRIDTVALACVVPQLMTALRIGIDRYFGLEPFLVDPSQHRIMPISYPRPAEIGADRLANAVAALELLPPPLVVIDFGTATTFDVISAAGEYMGGAIAPGIELSIQALFNKASRLPRIDLVAPSRAIGQSTAEGMQAGIIYGYAGLVDAVVRRIRGELGREAGAVATGGLAPAVVPFTETVQRIEPELTLAGIRIIHARNTPPGA